jgi:hypothetical protein
MDVQLTANSVGPPRPGAGPGYPKHGLVHQTAGLKIKICAVTGRLHQLLISATNSPMA